MDIWTFQKRISRRLFVWSGLSIFAGVFLLLLQDYFWTGVASQAVVWGLIDAGIAFFGQRSADKRKAKRTSRTSAQVDAEETLTLLRTLQVNAFLDLLYVAGGLWLALTQVGTLLQGIGWGVAAQGAVLFAFDLTHVFLLRKK